MRSTTCVTSSFPGSRRRQHRRPRLPHGPGHRPRLGLLVHAEHARRRRAVRLARSAHLVRRRPMSWYVRRHPRILIGGVLVAALLLVALFAPLIAPYDPTAVDVSQALREPSAQHWLGTDDLGRDVF